MYEECDVCGQNSYQSETGQLRCESCQDNKKINDLGIYAEKHDEEGDCTATANLCSKGLYQLKNNASCEVSLFIFKILFF